MISIQARNIKNETVSPCPPMMCRITTVVLAALAVSAAAKALMPFYAARQVIAVTWSCVSLYLLVEMMILLPDTGGGYYTTHYHHTYHTYDHGGTRYRAPSPRIGGGGGFGVHDRSNHNRFGNRAR